MTYLKMDNAELKAEADVLIRRCGLPELIAPYPGWFIGGSYCYDLMCWRDLDVYVLDPNRDLKCCFEIGYELTERLGALKSPDYATHPSIREYGFNFRLSAVTPSGVACL